MGKGLEAGKTFLEGVLSKISDPGQRAALQVVLQNETFVTEVGGGVEGQAEISRQLSTLRSQQSELEARAGELDQREAGLADWRDRLATWHQGVKGTLEEHQRLKAAGTGVPPTTPSTTPPTVPTGFTEAQYDERMAQERASFLGFSRDQNLITRDHFQKFGEIVELAPLIQHPKIAELGLIGVYQLVHKDRLEQFDKKAAETREADIRADERRKTLEAQAQMPYPPPTGAGSGSPLDVLDANRPQPVVDAAVAHFNRLQAERTATGAPR